MDISSPIHQENFSGVIYIYIIHADVVHWRRNTWEYGAFIYTTAAANNNAINRLLTNLSLNLSCLNVITLQGAE